MILSKRGEEMVEAAIVLPLLILLIVSIITATLFLYSSMVSTSGVQQQLTDSVIGSKGLFKVISRSGGAAGTTKGIAGTSLSSSYSEKGYVIDMGELLRIGRLMDE